MKKIAKIILKFISAGFIVLIIPATFFTLLTSRTSALMGVRSFTVVTGSMQPAIKIGSIVFTFPSANYHIGDIITFNRGKISVTHRIVGENQNGFRTQGDANDVADPQLVARKEVIGKDVLIVPYLGKLAVFFKTPLGFVVSLLVPTLIFIGLEFNTIKKEWEKELEKKILRKHNIQLTP